MRGIDPRDFALLPFGGAGPLHAAADRRRARHAHGGRAAAARQFLRARPADCRRAARLRAHARVAHRDHSRRPMCERRLQALLRDGEARAGGGRLRARRAAVRRQPRHALRSANRSSSPCPCAGRRRHAEQIERAFDEVYAARYGAATGRAGRDRQLSPGGVGTFGQAARCRRSIAARPLARRRGDRGSRDGGLRRRERSVHACSTATACRRATRSSGPALIEEAGSTTVVPPGWSAALDRLGCLVLQSELSDVHDHARSDHPRSPDAGADLDRARDARHRMPHRELGRDLRCQGLLLRPVRARQPGRRAVGGHRLACRAAALVGALGDGRSSATTSRPATSSWSTIPIRGGTHLNDVTIIYPVFRDGRLIFFPAVRAHWADVGGMVPGSMSGKATEIYQEGIRIPPLKIMEARQDQRGRARSPARQHARARGAARRLPGEPRRLPRRGEAHSRDLRTLRRRHAAGSRAARSRPRRSAHARLHRRPARRRRVTTRTISRPSWAESFEPLLLPLTLTVSGDRMIADFTGASPQVPFPVNSTAAVSAASVFIAVKSVFDPQAPLNQGSFRPIEVIAPPGTIVNVQRPAPAGSHGEIRKRVIATMVGALSQVAPDHVAGDLCRTSFHNLIGGYDTRKRPRVGALRMVGGRQRRLRRGRRAERHGDDRLGRSRHGAVVGGDGNAHAAASSRARAWRSTPAAPAARAADFRCSAPCASWRRRRAIRCSPTAPSFPRSACSAASPAFPSGPGSIGGGVIEDFDTPGKIAGHPVEEGATVVIRSAGGGGYGDPLLRDPERVATDVREGYVSSNAATQALRRGAEVRRHGRCGRDRTPASTASRCAFRVQGRARR